MSERERKAVGSENEPARGASRSPRGCRAGGMRAACLVLVSCWALFWALFLSSMPAGGQPKPSEYAVEAAYLLNFGKFMRVSPGGEAGAGSFNICVVGKDSLGPSLDEIAANEIIEGRPVRVVRLDQSQPQAQPQPQARQCAIAYFDASEQRRMEQDLALLHGSDTLTVSDAPDFLKHGGMIQLQLVSNHVRFSVNLEAVRRTHLVLSSELLRVAVSVTGNNPGEVQP